MRVENCEIPGLLVLTPMVHEDDRGSFMESYKRSTYAASGLPEFVQDNEVFSQQHVLRGLHLQVAAHAQGKLVHVIDGEILDVAVDVRAGSAHFGKHVAIVLSSSNRKQLWIPPGFAHGYIVRSRTAIVHYKCTAEYSPAHERCIRWDDPALGIDWGTAAPIVSERDRKGVLLREL